MKTWKTWILCIACLALAVSLIGANNFGKPKTLIHVVTVKWKDGTTDAQKKAVLEGVEKMAGEIPGIKNVWVNSIKVQPSEYTTAFVMEFESKAALDAYAKHPAHAEWMKVYEPVHEESRTSDVTN
jgi:antibiotic biosynthesis monooxygenase (ABM) superfamily enzyme